MIKIQLKKDLIGFEGNFTLDVFLEVEKNKFSVIFGKSGAGKTTILRMIAGLTEPEYGYIETNNGYWYNKDLKINLPVQK
ncbi:MAG: ATP-binding cassette domain-containing protein, partial [Candidatus Sericytochromatia bacterium]